MRLLLHGHGVRFSHTFDGGARWIGAEVRGNNTIVLRADYPEHSVVVDSGIVATGQELLVDFTPVVEAFPDEPEI